VQYFLFASAVAVFSAVCSLVTWQSLNCQVCCLCITK